MQPKTIRVRVRVPSAQVVVDLGGQIGPLPILVKYGAVVDIIDLPEYHIEKYRSAQHPKGWPAHLFEIVDDSVPVTVHFGDARQAAIGAGATHLIDMPTHARA